MHLIESDNEQLAIPIGAATLHIPKRALLETLMRAPAAEGTPTEPGGLTPPAIGSVWPGQAAIYAGTVRGTDGQPDYHLLVPLEPTEREKIEWPDALEWAESVGLALPNRQEARILWANVPELFADEWYWLGTQSAGNEDSAWAQFFGNGNQLTCLKDNELRARPVRRLTI